MKFDEFIKHLITRPSGYQLFWLYLIAYAEEPITIADASRHAGFSRTHGMRVLQWGEGMLKKLKIPFSRQDSGSQVVFSFKEIETELSELQQRHQRIVLRAIAYLNEVAGTSYRPELVKNQKNLKARLNENFTAIQIKQVIDTKVAEWKGTTQEKYLRPETLFGPKFESYLNQKQNDQPISQKLTGDELAKANIAIGRNVASGIFKPDTKAE